VEQLAITSYGFFVDSETYVIIIGLLDCSTLLWPHFLIHCSILTTDSTNSCPLVVNVYSTRGGISLYLCLSNMPLFSSSLSRIDSVLVLKPFKAHLDCLCLTGFVVQQRDTNLLVQVQTYLSNKPNSCSGYE